MATPQSPLPLIVGAGPVGLAAALFLARAGIQTRVIDRAASPSTFSKALAVNPRTLQILKSAGVTDKMLELGKPIGGICFWRRGKKLMEAAFDPMAEKGVSMIALAQGVTERLLYEALVAVGGEVERGVELIGCQTAADHVQADLRHTSNADHTTERYTCPWLFAADGSRSTARQSLKIDFPGTHFDRPWNLYDLPLTTSMPEDRGNIFTLDDGFVFCIRVVHDRRMESSGPLLWRVMGNVADPVSRLENASAAGPPVWSSSFHVAHRIVERMQQGQVYFAGDAAHLHSPVGARGMNLGIEDAWTFARLVIENRLHEYDAIRRPIDARVVRQVELLTRLARGESAAARFVRLHIMPKMIRIRAVRRRMMASVTGLDHPLDGTM